MDWFVVVVGLIILLLAGDVLVKGAVNLSLRLGVPALIVSLTIVAFGTSAPELLISIGAVLEGVPGIALGNVVGSNTANVLLVLGVPALIRTLHTSDCDTRRNYVVMIGATVVFIALAMTGRFGLWQGLVLLAMLGLILFDNFRSAKQHRDECAADVACEEEDLEGEDPDIPGWKIAVYLILGLIGLPLGAQLLIDGATDIARHFEIPETIIGLTLVALGTSLPELATTVMATLRRQADVALGNVIGSNLFNLLAIVGITTLVGPIPVPHGLVTFDVWVMLGTSLILIPFVFMRKNITRLWGLLLTALYLAYVVVLLSA